MHPNRLGMWFFIGSESVFFAVLIITFIMHRNGVGSDARELIDVPRTALFSLALFSSSATISVADRRFARGDVGGLRTWLLLTIALGLLFLAGQAWEYVELFDEGFDLDSGVFGSAFFTLTGFHGLHVIGGLILLFILWLVAGTRNFAHRGEGAVVPISMYWHFVDVVWIFVFSVAYLWGWL